MRTTLQSLLFISLFSTTVLAPAALAHGNTEPQFGGMVKIVGEYSFELKQTQDLTEVWVFYDGEALDSSKMALQLKIKGETQNSLVALKAAGQNRFSGNAIINQGDKVLAMLTLNDGRSKIVAKYSL